MKILILLLPFLTGCQSYSGPGVTFSGSWQGVNFGVTFVPKKPAPEPLVFEPAGLVVPTK